MTWSNRILDYHFNLHPSILLPEDVEWLLPYRDRRTQQCMTDFYGMYFQDTHPRTFILGINPGRFGAGLTGVPFTDPVRLEQIGIPNDFSKKQELSSVFVYDMIAAFGGCEAFYTRFHITSLSPLGLIRKGKNFNYYDDPAMAMAIRPFIIANITAQLAFGGDRSVVYCLGQGKNYSYLRKLNEEYQWWERIVPLPHPRWVMQYRLREKEQYIQLYLEAFRNV